LKEATPTLLEIPEIIVLNHFEEIYTSLIYRVKYSISQGLIMYFVTIICLLFKSQDSSVGIATGYELGGRGLIFGKGKIFLFPVGSTPVLGPTQPPNQWVPEGSFPGR
jgi:hypothetical protein